MFCAMPFDAPAGSPAAALTRRSAAGLKFPDLGTIHKGVQLHAPSLPHSARTPIRPLLKWAGGKRQLLSELSHHYPAAFRRYVEAFVGSGAVFFDLLRTGRLDGREVRLADVNRDLIGCYRALRDHAGKVIAALERLAIEHRKRGDACYYDVRDRRFNPQRASRNAGSYSPELAAMFIFLNRTGFNGLFRLNSRGGFNVPAGRYAEPRICDVPHLRAVADVFRRPEVSIEVSAFEDTLGDTGPGDFVYCDPPYAPLSRTSNFAHYTAGGFSAEDQQRLCDAVVLACKRGAHVIVSNSSAPEILKLYSARVARDAGLFIRRVEARRAINSRASARGPVDEVIVTNVREQLKAVRPRMARGHVLPRRRTA
jgi:DNA adenine methylase